MSKIAIDFGTARTKVAYFDEKSERPQVIELGREIRSILPSLFYIPRKGAVIVGDDAVEEGKIDRRGIVRGLKMELDTKTPIRRNKRKVDRVELAAILFCNIKHQCETLHFHDEIITDCILTIPPMFSTSPNKLQAIEEAANLGGFDKIEFIEEPIAAAKHWLAHGNTTTDYVFVCDIGGGTTDYALLKKIPDSEDFQVFAELPPFSSKVGGNNIDNGIFERLDLHGVDAQDKDAFLLQIRQYKEYVSRSPEKSPKIKYKKQTITNLREIILDECGEFIHLLKNDIERFLKKAQEIDSIDLTDIPLLLVGGGMNIHGLKDAFTKIWPGKVILWTESEHATVLGAIGTGDIDKPTTIAQELFQKAMTLWNETLRGKNKLKDITQSYCFIDDVINICDSSMEKVDRYPPSFNLKNILSSEKKLLDEIDKAKTAWEKKEFEKVIELCETTLKYHPQKDDLPLPAIEYYDDDLVTQVMLMQAEAYDADGKYKNAKNLTKECTDRKPDLKSAYMLRITTVLKGINAKQFGDPGENWSRLIDTIDHVLSLDDDKWGFGWSNISLNSLLLYKAYALFNQKDLKSCQVVLSDILNLSLKANKLNNFYLYNIISAYSYLKHDELDDASKKLENNILGNPSAFKFIQNNHKFITLIKEDLDLLPEWSHALNLDSSYNLLDGLLKWWIECNDLKDRKTIKRLCALEQKRGSNPWRFNNGSLIQNNPDFLLTMASVFVEEGKDSVGENCLEQLWEQFADVPLSQVLKESNLKPIVKNTSKPQIYISYDYGMLDNWIQVQNLSKYTLHDIRIEIIITFRDSRARERRYRSSPRLQKNTTISFKDEVFPGCGIGDRKYLTLWKTNIANVHFEVTCTERRLLDGQISCSSHRA